MLHLLWTELCGDTWLQNDKRARTLACALLASAAHPEPRDWLIDAVRRGLPSLRRLVLAAHEQREEHRARHATLGTVGGHAPPPRDGFWPDAASVLIERLHAIRRFVDAWECRSPAILKHEGGTATTGHDHAARGWVIVSTAFVVLADRWYRGEAWVEQLETALLTGGIRALPYRCDLSAPQVMQQLQQCTDQTDRRQLELAYAWACARGIIEDLHTHGTLRAEERQALLALADRESVTS